MSATLERRYRRLLGAYPASWRAANGEALLGIVLDAAQAGQRWPSPREAAALLLDGARTRARLAAAAGTRSLLSEALVLATLLLVLVNIGWALPIAKNIWPMWEMFALPVGILAALALLRGRLHLALVAVLASSANALLIAWDRAFDWWHLQLWFYYTDLMDWTTVVRAGLPVVVLLAALALRSGRRAPRSWAWLLLPVAIWMLHVNYYIEVQMALEAAVIVVMVGAVVLALVTGEARPALALAVYALPSPLSDLNLGWSDPSTLTGRPSTAFIPLFGVYDWTATPAILAVVLALTGVLALKPIWRRRRAAPGQAAG
jgi:hypothetical protein